MVESGDQCPDCQRGKVYPQRDPGVLVRVKGQAPTAAAVYELEKLRCNLCGDVFTAAVPEEVGEKKYDETRGEHDRLAALRQRVSLVSAGSLQENLGIPLPVATPVRDLKETAAQIQPAGDELIRQAAQGGVVHTTILACAYCLWTGIERAMWTLPRNGRECFTSGIVSIGEGYRIGLYFHRAQACRRESGRRAEAAGGRPGRADPDVRRAIAQSAQEVGTHYRALSGNMPAATLWKSRRTSHWSAGSYWRVWGKFTDSTKRRGRSASLRTASLLPPGTQRASNGNTAYLA